MRRLFWMGVGAVAGASGTVWAQQQVRRRIDRLAPDHVAVVAADAARRVGRQVVDAVAEGRDTMREREDELRRQLGGSTGHDARAVHRTVPERRPSRPAAWDRRR
jgi:hypothetical protein